MHSHLPVKYHNCHYTIKGSATFFGIEVKFSISLSESMNLPSPLCSVTKSWTSEQVVCLESMHPVEYEREFFNTYPKSKQLFQLPCLSVLCPELSAILKKTHSNSFKMSLIKVIRYV